MSALDLRCDKALSENNILVSGGVLGLLIKLQMSDFVETNIYYNECQ